MHSLVFLGKLALSLSVEKDVSRMSMYDKENKAKVSPSLYSLFQHGKEIKANHFAVKQKYQITYNFETYYCTQIMRRVCKCFLFSLHLQYRRHLHCVPTWSDEISSHNW